jgi:hypothetical protein
MALMVFLVTCPFSVLDFNEFSQQLDVQMGINQQYLVFFRSDPSRFFYRRFLYQILLIFPFFFGPLICLAALAGGVEYFRRERKKTILFLSFPGAYFLFSGMISTLVMPQYQLPYIPFVFILGSAGIVYLINKLSWHRSLGWAFLGLSIVFFLSNIFLPHFKGHFQVYQEAGEWIDKNIAKDKVAVSYFWHYPSTGYFGFRQEVNAKNASQLSLKQIEKTDPDIIFLAESSGFSENFCPAVFREYLKVVDLAREGSSGERKYELVREFRAEKWWERFAGMVYPEMKGFQINVYQKVEPSM